MAPRGLTSMWLSDLNKVRQLITNVLMTIPKLGCINPLFKDSCIKDLHRALKLLHDKVRVDNGRK